jgi:hypothetical protein
MTVTADVLNFPLLNLGVANAQYPLGEFGYDHSACSGYRYDATGGC